MFLVVSLMIVPASLTTTSLAVYSFWSDSFLCLEGKLGVKSLAMSRLLSVGYSSGCGVLRVESYLSQDGFPLMGFFLMPGS